MAGTQPLAATAVATLLPANLTANLKEMVTAHLAATATKMTIATLDPSQMFNARWVTLTGVPSRMEVLIPAPTLFRTPPWQAGKRRAIERGRTMRSGVLIPTLPKGLGVMVAQVGLIRVKGMGEGMEVVLLDMGDMGMTMEMEMKIVWTRFRVLKLREGRLGAEDEEEGMASRRR